jgi:hypothetical protein
LEDDVAAVAHHLRADLVQLLLQALKHLLDGSDPGRQTEALKGTVHILPSRLKAGHERER